MDIKNLKVAVIKHRTELLKGKNKKTLFFKNNVIKAIRAKLGI